MSPTLLNKYIMDFQSVLVFESPAFSRLLFKKEVVSEKDLQFNINYKQILQLQSNKNGIICVFTKQKN